MDEAKQKEIARKGGENVSARKAAYSAAFARRLDADLAR